MCLKGISFCSFHGLRNFAGERVLGGEHLTSSSTRTALTIDYKLWTHISNRMQNIKVPAFFLTVSYSFFISINQQFMKAYFAWKQLKADHSRNFWRKKKENCWHGFVCPLVGYRSVKMNCWKLQFCWCRSS